jgi:hypothetical protein
LFSLFDFPSGFWQKEIYVSKLLKFAHTKSRAYRLLNTIETADYSDVQSVKEFQHILDNEENKNELKDLDARYST